MSATEVKGPEFVSVLTVLSLCGVTPAYERSWWMWYVSQSRCPAGI